jgi:hypothetical protein
MQMDIPSPNDVLNAAMTGFELVVLNNVRDKLKNPKWVKDMKYGGDTDPYWRIVTGGEANDSEKSFVRNALVDAGWHRISIRNSSECGERAGLCEVTLYAKDEA